MHALFAKLQARLRSPHPAQPAHLAHPAHPSARQRGASLLEALVVVSIIGITAGSVLPSMTAMQDKRRLEGAAAQLKTELQYARSLAVQHQRTVRVSFARSEQHSCWVIHTGGPNACTCAGAATTCTGDAQALRTHVLDAGSRLRVSSNAASIGFDAVKGTVTPTASMTLHNAQDQRLRLVINILGRVRTCSDTGVRGYPAC